MDLTSHKSFFVTGTNTGVGKTYVSGLLAKQSLDKGLKVVTQKWAQSGDDDDIGEHLKVMGKSRADYAEFQKAMMPYKLTLPASPHLAAAHEGVTLDPNYVKTCYSALVKHFDQVIIEGSGGFLCPFTEDETFADLMVDLEIPVLLVSGNELGCINHTLLTIECIQRRGLNLLGVIMNTITDEGTPEVLADNPRIIEKISGVKILGNVSPSGALQCYT